MSQHADDIARSLRTGVEVSCAGKVRFDSFALANAVAVRGRRRDKCSSSAYLCGFCGGYHVGNQKRWVNTKLRGKAKRDDAGDE